MKEGEVLFAGREEGTNGRNEAPYEGTMTGEVEENGQDDEPAKITLEGTPAPEASAAPDWQVPCQPSPKEH